MALSTLMRSKIKKSTLTKYQIKYSIFVVIALFVLATFFYNNHHHYYNYNDNDEEKNHALRSLKDIIINNNNNNNNREKTFIEEGEDCDPTTVKDEDRCEYVKQFCDGFLNGKIDYVRYYYCDVKQSNQPFMFIFLLIFMAITFYFLGKVADRHFSPTLTKISEKLHLAEDVSGVTLLALGNGAPDLFSVVAAANSADYELVFGGLVGTGTFICSIILGLVAYIAKDVTFQKHNFSRDLFWYLICVIFLFFITASKKLQLWHAVILLLFYTIYVLVVIYTNYKKRKEFGVRVRNAESVDDLLATGDRNDDNIGSSSNGGGGIIGNDIVDVEDDVVVDGNNLSATEGIVNDGEDDDGDIHWENMTPFQKIIFCVCAPFDLLMSASIPPIGENDDYERWRMLTAPSLSLFLFLFALNGMDFFVINVEGGDASDGFKLYYLWLILGTLFTTVIYRLTRVNQMTIKMSIYNNYKTINDFSSSTSISSSTSYTSNLPPPITPTIPTSISSGLLGDAAVDTLPSSLKNPVLVWSFLSSICWFWITADEVVSILQTIGLIAGISQVILGVTILAWGNSIGDAVANIAISRLGYPQMAISACYAGPFFNACVGTGIALIIGAVKEFPNSINFNIDYPNVTYLGYIELIILLVSSWVVIALDNWKLKLPGGIVLISYYVICILLLILAEVGVLVIF